MKNIYGIKLVSLGKLGKEKEENITLNDCLIIRTSEEVDIIHLNELGKICHEGNLKYQIIYKPQNLNYEFKKYYSVYRMKYLISINLGERKKIDEKTFGRIIDLETIPQEVKLCVYNLINTINSYSTEETINKGISSESTDGYSISYQTPSKSIIEAKNSELDDIINTYLANTIIDNIPVLYRGVK